MEKKNKTENKLSSMFRILITATNAKLMSSFIVIASLIKKYLYFFIGLYFLLEYSYFDKLFHFVLVYTSLLFYI